MLRATWNYRWLAGIVGIAAVSVAIAQEPQPQLPEPTTEHEGLAREVGVWDAKVKVWASPDAEPMESKAVETNKMFGKFWLESEFKGEFGGMDYQGRGRTGYDPVSKKYVGTWYDSMTPYMMTMEGTYDVETKTLTMITEGRNSHTNEIEKGKVVSTYVDENTKKFEMHAAGPDGKIFKMMQIDYTRRKK